MLTGPGHFLYFLMLRSSFLEDLLCGFPRKQSETNQPIDPWLVKPLFEDIYSIHLSPQPFKNIRDDKERCYSLCILRLVWVKIS